MSGSNFNDTTNRAGASGSSSDTFSWQTFTPIVTLVGGAGNVVPQFVTNSGRFMRVGRLVYVDIFLDGDGGANGAGTGQINISLPITAGSSIVDAESESDGLIFTPSQYHSFIHISPGASTVKLRKFFDGGISTLIGADMADGTNRTIRLKFWYEVD